MGRSGKKKNIRGDFIASVLTGILLTSVLVNIYLIYANFNRNRVAKVVDGDSFETIDGRRLRLLGVNAPEVNDCMGGKAREMLAILIEGKVIRIRNAVKDDYGRILANVFSQGKFVNKEIVRRGLGRYTMGKNKYYGEMREAFAAAREEKAGIFSSLCRQTKASEDCLIKGNLRQGKKTYHLPGCPNYEQVIVDTSYGDKWFCSEEEATAEGFRKAEGCF